ncbi:2-oxoadipate dehydrogenase complex component E1-like [Littorina saxatilis]|uniref:Transketolase-like pyrimidine-binding domain-containing protein n=1 Tax=Littorina saxatilis TaxID=31220 RepID=A0AAN9BCG8_9CAEN
MFGGKFVCARFAKHLKCRRAVALYHSKSGVYGNRVAAEPQLKETFSEAEIKNRIQHATITRLVQAYRQYGHRKAQLDPLGLQKPKTSPELDLRHYGVTASDSSSVSLAGIFYGGGNTMQISELIDHLERLYCGSLAAEFEHLVTEEERTWFAETFETRHTMDISQDRQVALAKLMLKCQAFDHFLSNKFTTVKRYGGEGGESMMGCFDEVFRKCSEQGMEDVVVCMPHRGRLNFLTSLLDFPPVIMFQKMKGKSEFPPGAKGTGDVLSHLYTSVDLPYGDKNVHVSLIPNPSHLEANNPVAAGKARAKQQRREAASYSSAPDATPGDQVLCLQVHGDASFSGQGVVAETFCFANCAHFTVGGSVHLIVNNQIGYTTEATLGRSSEYVSDLAKINGCPVIHVNADNPEDVVRATSIAMDYRYKFHKDVIIDLMCFRRWGHNEMDEPSFTQPIMYQAINSRQSIPDNYANTLVSGGVCEQSALDTSVQEWNTKLAADMAKADSHVPQPFHLGQQWSGLVQASDDTVTAWDTGVPLDILKFVGVKSVDVPVDFNVHPTIQRTHVERRRQKMSEGGEVDWATAEALAMGSLMYQGVHVRISGQDVGRGTFSQRHAMLVDQQTDDIRIPLNHMMDTQQGFLEVAHSVLSEEAVLGFEYGVSLETPQILPIWEAQFGDFFNGAQIMIDTYISSGELKWLLQSGIVMLLPHGMDGAGPEHSSCRIERFLQMCDSKEDGVDGDNVNMQVAHPTTPAQYFHLMRRQVIRNFRKPLIVAAPKLILRLPAAVSSMAELLPGNHFLPVLSDASVSPGDVKKVVFCSGKHFYTLDKERQQRGVKDTAIVRVESLCPFPAIEVKAELDKFSQAKEFVWSQEEHRNMGAWTFVAPRFANILGYQLKYVGRGVLGSPAVGVGDVHKVESQKLLDDTFQQS